MPIRLGADTLCWHLRLETGTVSMEEVLAEAAGAGAECVQVNLHHLRMRDLSGVEAVAAAGRELGLELLASGDFLGRGREGDEPAVGISRITDWLEHAQVLGSRVLRVVSGFYRADLAGQPEQIDAERRYVAAVLRGAAPEAEAAGVKLLLENHSDFTAAEYETIVEESRGGDGDGIGVFLDLINPVAALEDPAGVVERLAPSLALLRRLLA